MPHPTKKQRLDDGDQHQRNEVVVVMADNHFAASFDDLSTDVLPNILGFLSLQNIMRSRRINKKTREAVRKTIVPPSYLCVDNAEKYNAMVVMTRAMPNLQQIKIGGLEPGNKYSDGEDPDEWTARTASNTTHDIGIISNFSKLRVLEFDRVFTQLNGRYPVFVSSFPLLQKLTMRNCYCLKFDLNMLAGLPMIKELECWHSYRLTGNVNSLSLLKDTLEKVNIRWCDNVEGNLMDLADFPHLKKLDLEGTAVTGDIRDIGENDFSSLEYLCLPKSVYGGVAYEFRRISDGPDLINKVYLFSKQRPTLSFLEDWYVRLSADSPDWYESAGEDEDADSPPFDIGFVQAGSRIGYRWETANDIPCEVNWLDSEPDRESSDFAEYIEELRRINSQVHMYRGFHQPPTEEEYIRLWEEYR